MALSYVAPSAFSARRPLQINRTAAMGLAEVMSTNLGPKGSVKLLVGGAGQLKLSKDGHVLLSEMAIQHPTGMMIARAATAQDDVTGDGTTSVCVMIAEVLKRADENPGIHQRCIIDGLLLARDEALRVLDGLVVRDVSRRALVGVAHTALSTKLPAALATQCAEHCVDAVELLGDNTDLHMVEVMHMKHRLAADSTLVRGLVMDHGSRHPQMPKRLSNCFILTCNVCLEYEKTEINTGMFYHTAEQKVQLAKGERSLVDARCHQIVALKKKVCGDDPEKGFVVINQKGIDQPSLDILAEAGILALRRAKKRNMERVTLACGGTAVFNLDDLSEADLGWAGEVWEHAVGDEKYTFIDKVKNPRSCTLLIRGAHEHTINQVKDSLKDGLRAVFNAKRDGGVLPGAGAPEVAIYRRLQEYAKDVEGKAKVGVRVFAEAAAAIPRALATNAGLDTEEVLFGLVDHCHKTGQVAGLALEGGAPIDPASQGIYDSICVKRHIIMSSATIASQLLMVDEIIKAGNLK